jgi:nitric oxide synthase-interacting protein
VRLFVDTTHLRCDAAARGTKRKFEFDTSAVETVAKEAEETALLQIEKEQAEALKHKLPDFWLPSLTPTYQSSGPPQSLSDFKVQTMCRGGNPPHHVACVIS